MAAPFIKSGALARILQVLPQQTSLVVYTRWRLDELASGVSDLDCFQQIRAHPNARMLLCPRLHAKAYLAGDAGLVGSANLTGKGLGWAPGSNLEILVPIDPGSPELAAFLLQLKQDSFRATPELYALFRRLVDAFQPAFIPQEPPTISLEKDQSDIGAGRKPYWLPTMRHPALLYRAYSGKSAELTAAAKECAQHDLLNLNPPPGMTKDMFYAFVQGQMLQHPVVRRLEHFLAPKPRSFGRVRDFLQHNFGALEQDWSGPLQTLMRWLGEFLPGRYIYAQPAHAEIIGLHPGAVPTDPTDTADSESESD